MLGGLCHKAVNRKPVRKDTTPGLCRTWYKEDIDCQGSVQRKKENFFVLGDIYECNGLTQNLFYTSSAHSSERFSPCGPTHVRSLKNLTETPGCVQREDTKLGKPLEHKTESGPWAITQKWVKMTVYCDRIGVAWFTTEDGSFRS